MPVQLVPIIRSQILIYSCARRVSDHEIHQESIVLFPNFIRNFPKCRRASRAMYVVISARCYISARSQSSPRFERDPLHQMCMTYLSNQLPRTPLPDLIQPTCMPSLRHRSSPWKIENVVQRISPSGVWRTVPIEVRSAWKQSSTCWRTTNRVYESLHSGPNLHEDFCLCRENAQQAILFP